MIERLEFDKTMQTIDELKKENLPIVIWGAGNVATDVLIYLKSNGIHIEDIFVDEEYYRDDLYLADYRILKYSNIKEKYGEFCVVMGMMNLIRGKEIEDEPQVKRVFYITNATYGLTERFEKEKLDELDVEYNELYDELSDDLSQKCLIAWLNARINDDPTFVFPCYEGEQNYFRNSIYHVKNGESFCDIGAYDGDTMRQLLNECEQPGHIWAIEADTDNYEKLCEYLKNESKNLEYETYNRVLWRRSGEVCFHKDNVNLEDSMICSEGNGEGIKALTLDELLAGREDKVDLLKVNFPSGYELIYGAEEVINTDHPKIAITVGWGIREPIDAARALASKGYHVYLRFNSSIPAKLCMYAT